MRQQNTPQVFSAQRIIDTIYQAKAQSWIDLDICQLSPGRYAGSCDSVETNDIHLVHEQQNRNVHKTGTMTKGKCTLSMALHGQKRIRFSHYYKPESSSLFLLPEQSNLDIVVPEGVETLYFCFDQIALQTAMQQLNPRGWEKMPEHLVAYQTPNINLVWQHALECMQLAIQHSLSDGSSLFSKVMQTQLYDLVLMALNNAASAQHKDEKEIRSAKRYSKIVTTTRDYLNTCLQLAYVPSIVELCRHACVSERTLLYAFQTTLHMTTQAYMRIVRLNCVRATLIAEAHSTNVTEVATRWGFLHLGKFASDYRQLFAEVPSDTLRKA